MLKPVVLFKPLNIFKQLDESITSERVSSRTKSSRTVAITVALPAA